MSWHENRIARPLKVGGRFDGRATEYESDLGGSCLSGHAGGRDDHVQLRLSPAARVRSTASMLDCVSNVGSVSS